MIIGKIRKERSSFIYLFLILVIAGVVRLVNLNQLPIFADEAIYVRWSQVMNAVPSLRFLPQTDGKQPLYMWALMFAVNRFSDPLIVGRVLSAIFGMVTLTGVYFLSKRVTKSTKVSLVAALIYALSPFSAFFDRMALVDSMLTAFVLWTSYFGVVASQTMRHDYAMVCGFCLGGALLTKSPSLFISLLLPVSWTYSKWPGKKMFAKKNIFHGLRLVALFVPTYIIAYGMYNVLRLGEDFHKLTSRNLDYVYPLSHVLKSPLDPFLPFFDRIIEYLWIFGGQALFVLFISGLYKAIKSVDKQTAPLLVWFIVPVLAISFYSKTMTARYVLFVLPFYYIIAAYSLDKARGMTKKALFALLFLFLLTSVRSNYFLTNKIEKLRLPRSERSGYLEEWTSGHGIKEVSEILRLEWEKDKSDGFVVGTEGHFGTLPDGLQIYLNDLPEIKVIGVGIDLGEVPQALKESAKAGNRTYLVINSSRLKFDYRTAEMDLVVSYSKAMRPQGTREYNLFGPSDSLYLFRIN